MPSETRLVSVYNAFLDLDYVAHFARYKRIITRSLPNLDEEKAFRRSSRPFPPLSDLSLRDLI